MAGFIEYPTHGGYNLGFALLLNSEMHDRTTGNFLSAPSAPPPVRFDQAGITPTERVTREWAAVAASREKVKPGDLERAAANATSATRELFFNGGPELGQAPDLLTATVAAGPLAVTSRNQVLGFLSSSLKAMSTANLVSTTAALSNVPELDVCLIREVATQCGLRGQTLVTTQRSGLAVIFSAFRKWNVLTPEVQGLAFLYSGGIAKEVPENALTVFEAVRMCTEFRIYLNSKLQGLRLETMARLKEFSAGQLLDAAPLVAMAVSSRAQTILPYAMKNLPPKDRNNCEAEVAQLLLLHYAVALRTSTVEKPYILNAITKRGGALGPDMPSDDQDFTAQTLSRIHPALRDVRFQRPFEFEEVMPTFAIGPHRYAIILTPTDIGWINRDVKSPLRGSADLRAQGVTAMGHVAITVPLEMAQARRTEELRAWIAERLPKA